MKQIPLTQGQFALVDDEDYDELIKHEWQAQKKKKNWYAFKIERIGNSRSMVMMHRSILNGSNDVIDHIDRNGLNNQKSNLRFCTYSENAKNKSASGSSAFLGVSEKIIKSKGKEYNYWRATIKIDKKYKHLGYFKDEKQAAVAYNDAAKVYHKEFANLNIIT